MAIQGTYRRIQNGRQLLNAGNVGRRFGSHAVHPKCVGISGARVVLKQAQKRTELLFDAVAHLQMHTEIVRPRHRLWSR